MPSAYFAKAHWRGSVVRTREDLPRAFPIGGELTDLVERTINHISNNLGIAQIPTDKVIHVGVIDALPANPDDVAEPQVYDAERACISANNQLLFVYALG
jgi:hypothetical protein